MTGGDNRGPAFVVVFGSLVAIAILLVVLRIWVRIKIIRKLGLDDWIMMASLVCSHNSEPVGTSNTH